MRKLLTLSTAIVLISQNNAFAGDPINYYVNGISTIPERAADHAEEMQTSGVGLVAPLYNTSQGFFIDLQEVIGQVFNVDGFYTPDGTVSSDHYTASVLKELFAEGPDAMNVSVKVFGMYKSYQSAPSLQPTEASDILINPVGAMGCSPFPDDFVYGVSTPLLTHLECNALMSLHVSGDFDASDVVQALKNVNEQKGEIFIPSNQAFTDLNTWLTEIGDLSQETLNLVCHSQGNEFCNRLATHIDGQGYGDGVKVLSVATPDNYVYGDGSYITLREDLASAFFLSSLPQNATNYSWLFDEPWFWVSGNILKYGDVTGHGFLKSYLLDGSLSRNFVMTAYASNYDSFVQEVCPNCTTETELGFGYVQSIWTSSSPSPDHYSSGYAKNFTFTHSNSCRKVEFKVGSEVDSYIDLRVNGVLIGNDDNSGVSGGAEMTVDINGGTYDLEVTGKSLYSDATLNTFGLTITDRGVCDSTDSSNIYVENSTIDGEDSNIYLSYGQEIQMRTYQKYSGTVLNSDLDNPNLEYIFSRDQNRSSNDLVVETDYSTIGSDDVSDVESEYVIIPDSMGTGRWYAGFVVDSDNEIQETNESDNIEWIEVYVSAGAPASAEDIYLETLVVPDEPMFPGERYRFKAKPHYSGDRDSSDVGSVKLYYYLSDDAVYSSDDEYIGSDSSSIGSDDEYDNEAMYYTPTTSDIGVRYVIFRADATDIVDETDEDNIWVSDPIAIFPVQ